MMADDSRVEKLFNDNWSFVRADAATPDKLPVSDVAWKKVDVPHDYSFESDFVEVAIKQKKSNLTVGELGLYLGSRSTGYLPGGPGWYKKTFDVPEEYAGKKVQILFDGVFMASDVYLNGKLLGHHHYGYTAFHYDLTPHLKVGESNEISVRTENELLSRWYPGSGIYRDVKLIVTDPVRIPIWGTFVTTPDVSAKSAQVVIETKIGNDCKDVSSVMLVSDIMDSSGKKVASVESKLDIAAGAEAVVNQKANVENPALWSIGEPNLYRVVSKVMSEGKELDARKTIFGIRTLKFDADEGFFLNGVYTRMYGVCMHHDNGLLGAESYSWAEERKIIKLKEMGCNAIRCAHNPPSKAMLDACDRQGMLVINEAFDEWKRGKAEGYGRWFDEYWNKDIDSMLYRDRNHPCIIMWSTGNEVPDQGTADGPALSKMLADHIRTIDGTRPVTLAVQPGEEDWGNHFPVPEVFAPVEISGYNYESLSREIGGHFQQNHKEFPDRIMYQSESMNSQFYDDWMNIISTKYILGDFVWSGVDYLGEVGCGSNDPIGGSFPAHMALCGDLDICCFRKPRSYYRQLLWREEPTVYLTVVTGMINTDNKWGAVPSVEYWTFKEETSQTKTVEIYSGCEEAELFLNGKSLGRKATSRETRYKETWKVPYKKGELKAVGYVAGKAVAEHVIKTAAEPVAISLTADRKAISSDGSDVCYVTAEIVDENGVRNPLGDNELEFEVTGPATIAGVGNSSSHAPVGYPFHGNKCKAFEGRALLILRSGMTEGSVTVKASAKGLKSGSAQLKVE